MYGGKHCERKEKSLVTSNFFFSYNVFHSYIFLVSQNVALCGNGLTRWCRVELNSMDALGSTFT